jgi:hypothetical protein
VTYNIEEKDPSLLVRIRQLSRKGLNRKEMFTVLRNEGRIRSFSTLRRIIQRCHVAVALAGRPPSLSKRAHQMRLSLAQAKLQLATEVTEARAARSVAAPFKSGDLEW